MPKIKKPYKMKLSKQEYKEYLKSEHWKDVKRRFKKSKLIKGGLSCYICDSSGVKINIHHKTYKRLWNERLTDLVALCDKCHLASHLWLLAFHGNKTNLWNVAKKLRKKVKKRGKWIINKCIEEARIELDKKYK